jgi:hypothetical protein
MEPTLLLIVKVAKGLIIRDTPRPESQGGIALRSVPVGTQLYAYDKHNIGGVDYARLVPQNPQKPEWVRVAEADHSIVYVDVIELGAQGDNADVVNALNNIADAIRSKAA